MDRVHVTYNMGKVELGTDGVSSALSTTSLALVGRTGNLPIHDESVSVGGRDGGEEEWGDGQRQEGHAMVLKPKRPLSVGPLASEPELSSPADTERPGSKWFVL